MFDLHPVLETLQVKKCIHKSKVKYFFIKISINDRSIVAVFWSAINIWCRFYTFPKFYLQVFKFILIEISLKLVIIVCYTLELSYPLLNNFTLVIVLKIITAAFIHFQVSLYFLFYGRASTVCIICGIYSNLSHGEISDFRV